jgi:hypothetical protein
VTLINQRIRSTKKHSIAKAVPRHVAVSDGDRARATVGARLQAERFRYGGRTPADAVVRTRCRGAGRDQQPRRDSG